MNGKLYKTIQWTWGFPQTLAGAVLHYIHRKDIHFDYEGVKTTVWERNDGVSLGAYIFVPAEKTGKRSDGLREPDQELLLHEYGHTKQSLVLGPIYLPVVGLPSLIWNKLPYFTRLRSATGKSYDAMPIERMATHLGARSKSSNMDKKQIKDGDAKHIIK